MSKEGLSEAWARLEAAQEYLRAAKEAHVAEFKEAYLALCNEYRLVIIAEGYEGSRLDIAEVPEGASPLTIRELELP